jgi:hypothetical protein
MVRDLGKDARLAVLGAATPINRAVMTRIEGRGVRCCCDTTTHGNFRMKKAHRGELSKKR